MEVRDQGQGVAPVTYVLLVLMALALVLGFCLPGEWGAFFKASQDGVLMALTGVLAYVGLKSRVARTSAWLLLGACLTLLVLFNVVFAAAICGAFGKHTSLHALPPDAIRVVGCVLVVSVLAALASLVPLFKSSHRLCAAITGNSEWTSVRVLAFGGVVAITLLLFVPICTLGKAPMLALLQQDGDLSKKLVDEMSNSANRLSGDIYDLCWSLFASTLAVGFGVRRNWRECLDRLGIVKLSPRQIVVALGLTALVYAMSEGLDLMISRVWVFFDWPVTGEKAYEVMFKAFSSPFGAMVIGVTAGFGEEVLVRGILQPRLGILLSSLFFTALHAYQYNWDALLSVFLFGLTLGLIRKKTNTSVCVIVHGGYDFVLTMIAAL